VTNPNCTGFAVTTSTPQPAGFSTQAHSANFLAAFSNQGVTCPAGHGGTTAATNCTHFSIPLLANSIFWQNRSFNITVASATPPSLGTINLVPALNQGTTGFCDPSAHYWDIGTYGDTSPTAHGSGITLTPQSSMFSAGQGYTSNSNSSGTAPGFVSQYCNGSRVPPEIATQLCTSAPNGNANAPGCIPPGQVGVSMSTQGGVPDALTPPLPAFTLAPAATVDEGSNWINMFYGPLSLSNPTILSGSAGYGVALGNYALVVGAGAFNFVPPSSPTHSIAPRTDFFGNPRPDAGENPNHPIDAGAVESH
jgi:hypothetical protein